MSNIHLQQAAEFFGRFFRLGGTIQMIKQLLGDDELMTWWMEQLKIHAKFKLVHGVFNPAADILEASMLRLAEKGFVVDQFTWIGPKEAPDFDSRDHEMVVVLDVTLGSLQETLEFAWDWAVEGQEDSWRWGGLETTPDKLRLLEGSEAFQPMTLRWRRIKLNVNVAKAPKDVRDPKASPGLALLFVAAQHPQRVKVIDYEKYFGWHVPGLECTAPGLEPWQGVPYVYFSQGDRQVGLSAVWCERSHGTLAVPVLRE